MADIGPDSDIDVPAELHIEELLGRALFVSAFIIGAALIAFPLSDGIIEFLWNTHIPEPDLNRPRLYSPISTVLMRFKVVVLAALSVSFPVIIYQFYDFSKPALYEMEQYYLKISSVLSIALSSLAVLLSHYVVIPLLYSYFTSYTQGAADIAFSLEQTVGMMLSVMIYLIVAFQMPILILVAVISGIVTAQWIARRRLAFWGLFATIAFLSSPDPTGTAPFIIALLMLLLFETTLIVVKRLPKSDRSM